jgi:hypothetical protein
MRRIHPSIAATTSALLLAAAALLPVTPSAAAGPIGNFERVVVDGPNHATASGWAIDPDSTGPVRVHVYADGRWAGAVTADRYRPDVGNAHPGYGDFHGFAVPIGLGPGAHTVCAYVIDTSGVGPNLRIGCRTVTVGRDPRGNYEALTLSETDGVASGWVIDPNTAAPVRVHIYRNDRWAAATTADRPRPDVGARYPAWGPNHGFGVDLGPIAEGDRLCVYAINDGAGHNTRLGCRAKPWTSWPTPATTGVPAGWSPKRVHSGNYTASTPGQVIDGWRITGTLTIKASNVTVRNSEIYDHVWLASRDPYRGLLLEDTTVGPPTGASSWGHGLIGTHDYTARGVEVRNGADFGRVTGNNVLIEHSFFKAAQPGGCTHVDGVQGYFGGRNVILRHNTFDAKATCSNSPIFFGDWSQEVRAYDNLVRGGAHSLKSNDDERVNMLQVFHGNRIVDGSWDWSACDFHSGRYDLADNRLVTIDAGYRVTSIGSAPRICN